MSRYRFRGYVSVAKQKEKAFKKVKDLKKEGEPIQPVIAEGRNISNTFWGQAWCNHVKNFEDYNYRLSRGRSYLRSGAVLDLSVKSGKIEALVLGAYEYDVIISVKPIETDKWQKIVAGCIGHVDSIVELLQGKISKAIMEKMAHVESGLFPATGHMSFSCSCYDQAHVCKHVAAALYGVGVRLDTSPEDLFILRGVNPADLLTTNFANTLVQADQDNTLDGDLSEIFGIDLTKN
jgi:uncharacterized Zn finger protein